MAVKTLYRGSTDKLLFTVIDCETGAGMDLTGKDVAVRFQLDSSVTTFIGSGYSSDALFTGTLTKEDETVGECSIQFAEGDSLTGVVGSYNAHVQVSSGVAVITKYKYVQQDILRIEDHAIK